MQLSAYLSSVALPSNVVRDSRVFAVAKLAADADEYSRAVRPGLLSASAMASSTDATIAVAAGVSAVVVVEAVEVGGGGGWY